MVGVKIFVVSAVAVLFSAFQQPGIRAQSTIDSSTEDDSCSQLEEELVVENMRLQGVLESERQTIKKLENERHRLKTRKSQSVKAKFTGRLGFTSSPRGITIVDDRIYVLDISDKCLINVFENRNDFRFIQEIALNESRYPYNIVYRTKSKYVYISDYNEKCIWKMATTGEHRLTKWLTNVLDPYTVSLSNEGHLLVLRYQTSSQLDIYALNATLIRRLLLPQDVKNPLHVVQISDGNFIILHQLNTGSGRWVVISQLTNDGHLIHRFIPRNQSENLRNPKCLSLDSDNNRLFVTDMYNNRVVLFDSNVLTWRQVLEFEGISGIHDLRRLFYDAGKRHLFVAQECKC